MIRKLLLWLLALAFVGVVTQSCGTFGESGNENGEDDQSGRVDAGSSTALTNYVSATFHLGDSDNPAIGYQVWFLNHTERSFVILDLDSEGAFSYAVKNFDSGSTYTVHLVDSDYVEIGMIDMSSATSGTQGAIVYSGGLGFKLGTIVVNVDTKGEVDLDDPGLDGKVGGGFSVNTSSALELKSFSVPEFVSSLDVEGELTILDPAVLLNSFYLRDSYPTSYANALMENSRIQAVVKAASEDGVLAASVLSSGDWLAAARIVSEASDGPLSSTLWSIDSYGFTAASSTVYEANVFSGRVIKENSLMLVRITPASGAEQFIGPAVLRYAFTMPPMLTSISLDGGSLASIDYSADTENGLTVPFSASSSDITLELSPPEDPEGTAVPHTVLDTVEIEFLYYGVVSSALSLLEVEDSSFAAYNGDVSETLTNMTRVWDVSERKLTYTLDSISGAGSRREIVVPIEFMLRDADKVEARIYFKNSSELQKSGIVVWFDPT